MTRYQKHGTDPSDIFILGIETSCDETSAAVVKNGKEILSNVISSQMDVHERFGGVVPEIASRKHAEQITLIIEKTLHEADISLDDVHAVAVTYGPGLVGALLVGVSGCQSDRFCQRDSSASGSSHRRSYLCESAGGGDGISFAGPCRIRRTYGDRVYAGT